MQFDYSRQIKQNRHKRVGGVDFAIKDYSRLKKDKTNGWFIGLLLIISFIILIGLIVSVDWQACADSPKGFCG